MELIVYSAIVVLAAWLGGAIPLFLRSRPVAIGFFISFGAGVLLGAALLHMLPDAAAYLGRSLGVPTLLGFLTLYIFEKFLMTHPCPAPTCDYHHVGLSAFVGLSFHSLISGIALGSGALVPELGLVVFLAVALHKLPASLSLSSLLIKEGYRTRSVVLIVFVFSLMVPIGALATYLLAQNLDHATIGFLIAFSGGTFLHIAADDLIPEVHHELHFRNTRLMFFLLGIALMWLVSVLE